MRVGFAGFSRRPTTHQRGRGAGLCSVWMSIVASGKVVEASGGAVGAEGYFVSRGTVVDAHC